MIVFARCTCLVLALAAGGCASTGSVPRPFPGAAGPPAGDAPAARPITATSQVPGAVGYAVTGTALSLRGVPYRNGGNDPTGFDCSGLVWFVFAQHGVPLARTVSDLYRAGELATGPLLAGDLVFFSTAGPGATHVGIAIGGDEFVHAPSSTGQVRVERLSSPYWAPRFVGARRVSR